MSSSAPRKTSGQGRLYDSIVDTIGNTPCIRINQLAPKNVTVYVKAEFFNPAASVKDRLAISIIEEAERSGALKPGQTVVEATSGNTGIGLAMVCAAKGYPLVVTMADSFSIERRKLMRFLGAKVILTPRAAKGMGMYLKAKELADKNGWFLARQFETAANATIHENTSGVAQTRGSDNGPSVGHSAWTPHPVQGWTPDFIPYVLQEGLDKKYYDQLVTIPGPAGIEWSRKLAQKEGIFTGISGGATFAVAMQIAEKAPEGSTILAMLPDTGERYMTTPLFEGIVEGMSPDEDALSKSTPGYQMPPPA
jgi:cysteine synthase A